MQVPWFQPSILIRDNKLFLQLSAQEADVWLPRVFDRIRPQIDMVYGLVFEDVMEHEPLNLELALMLAIRGVREVAREMAADMFTPDRLAYLVPVLNAYCDELLAQDRPLDATYVQQGLIQIEQDENPSNNPLLVEVCISSIFHQVDLFNSNPRSPMWSH
jgi:hypothetical protein